jgi:haloalkane dehalogenase
MKKGYVDTDFGQVHYYADGDSGPLVFLFHETALSANEFERTLPHLGKTCRAVAFDTPGYGMSDAPTAPLGMPEMSEWLGQAIDHFGPGPCALAGAHTGASLILDLAIGRLADRTTHTFFTGLGLLGPDEIAGFRKIIGKSEMDPDGQFLVEQWNKRRKRWGEDTPLEDIFWGLVEQLKVYKRAFWAFETVFTYDTESALKKLSCPAYFLVGEHDSLVESDKRAAKLAPNATVKVLAGKKGRLPYFEPELYAQELLDFIGQ